MPFDNPLGDVHLTYKEEITPTTVILIRLERFLTRWKWTQGRLERPWFFWNRYCVIGATRLIESQYDLNSKAETALDRVAQKHGYHDIATLNDHPDIEFKFIKQIIQEAIEDSKRIAV